MDFQTMSENYARLLLEAGLHLQRGEGLILTASTEALPMARRVTELAYEAGAKDVVLELIDDAMMRARFTHGSEEALSFYPEYKALHRKELYDDHYHHLFLVSRDPKLYEGIAPEKISGYQNKAATVNKTTGLMAYRMTGKTKWTLTAIPSVAWAKSIFPDWSDDEALDALWKYVFQATRADQDDPIHAWNEHDRNLKRYRRFLNEKPLDRLHFTGPGTDLIVPLADGHFWMGGAKESQAGDPFWANIPTEEVFTTPHRAKVEGKVTCTKPLNLNGHLIEDIVLVFREGKVVDFSASKGREVLERQLNQDEGARRLGEIALVPNDSPISNTGIVFNDTLFDENAACHLALGQSYGYAMIDGAQKTSEELLALGANESIIHTDIMIGDEHTEIVGITKNGESIPLFEKGNWASSLFAE